MNYLTIFASSLVILVVFKERKSVLLYIHYGKQPAYFPFNLPHYVAPGGTKLAV